jgi:tetratricopeptide (TPR) repeat protein
MLEPSPRRLLALACAGWLLACAPGGAPALPDDGQLDPDLRLRVDQARAAVGAAPGDARLWTELGMTYEGNDLHAQARECYRQALRLEESARRWARLGTVSSRLGAVEEGLGALRRAIELEPSYAPSHWRLGNQLFDAGEFDQALASYQEAARLDPSFTGAWTGIARVFLMREESERALELLERLSASNPGHAHVQKLLKAAYVQAGRLDEAEALTVAWSANASPGKDPWQAEFRPYLGKPLLERAREHLEAGRPAEAVALLEPFLAEGSEDWNAHGYLAWGYFLLGRLSEARAVLDAALARDPDNALVLRVLSSVQEKSGEAQAALATLERLLAADPHDEQARAAHARLTQELARAQAAR